KKIDAWHIGNTINPYQIGGEFIHTDGYYFKPISGNHVVRNCIFDIASGPKFNGISGSLLIENNNINDSFINGILYDPLQIADESHVIVRNNTISNSGLTGYWLWGTDNILFENNKIINSTSNGLMLLHSHNNRFINNEIINCESNAIVLDSSFNNTFINNVFRDNENDFFWEGQGGEIIFGGSSVVNSIMVSNNTFARVEGLELNIDQLNVELFNIETELESERNNAAGLEYQLEEASDDFTRLESELGEAESEIVDLNSHIDSKYSLSTVAMIAVIVMVISGVIVYLISRRE
ncbi:MAG: right-handed parallel beta-helix repeat-containing protein, partial [Candidatus Bathyarchaeota archaeon]